MLVVCKEKHSLSGDVRMDSMIASYTTAWNDTRAGDTIWIIKERSSSNVHPQRLKIRV